MSLLGFLTGIGTLFGDSDSKEADSNVAKSSNTSSTSNRGVMGSEASSGVTNATTRGDTQTKKVGSSDTSAHEVQSSRGVTSGTQQSTQDTTGHTTGTTYGTVGENISGVTSGATTGVTAGTQTGTQTGSLTGSTAGTIAGTQTGSLTGSTAGSTAASILGTTTGITTDTLTGTTAGVTTGQTSGTVSGAQTQAQTAKQAQEAKTTMFSSDILASLDAVLKSSLTSGDMTTGSDAIKGRLQQVQALASGPDFDVGSYVSGITAAATSATQSDLDSRINTMLSATGSSEVGNSMSALLANKLRNEAAANLAGISATATASGEQIRQQQQANYTNQIEGLSGGLSAQITNLLGVAAGAQQSTSGTGQTVSSGQTTTQEANAQTQSGSTQQTTGQTQTGSQTGTQAQTQTGTSQQTTGQQTSQATQQTSAETQAQQTTQQTAQANQQTQTGTSQQTNQQNRAQTNQQTEEQTSHETAAGQTLSHVVESQLSDRSSHEVARVAESTHAVESQLAHITENKKSNTAGAISETARQNTQENAIASGSESSGNLFDNILKALSASAKAA